MEPNGKEKIGPSEYDLNNVDPSEWSDDIKKWPPLSFEAVKDYLLLSEAFDGPAGARKSLDAMHFFISGWVSSVLVHTLNDKLCYVKCLVKPSQKFNKSDYECWVLLRTEEKVTVIKSHCTCMTGVCSHIGALLFKVEYANRTHLSGLPCTDVSMSLNQGTKRNIVPKKLSSGTLRKKQFKRYSSHQEMVKDLENSPLKALLKIPGTLLHKTLNCKIITPETVTVSDSENIQHGGHDCDNLSV